MIRNTLKPLTIPIIIVSISARSTPYACYCISCTVCPLEPWLIPKSSCEIPRIFLVVFRHPSEKYTISYELGSPISGKNKTIIFQSTKSSKQISTICICRCFNPHVSWGNPHPSRSPRPARSRASVTTTELAGRSFKILREMP